MLVIPRVRLEDGGKYECRGTGVQTGHVAVSSAQVIINSKPDNGKYKKILFCLINSVYVKMHIEICVVFSK